VAAASEQVSKNVARAQRRGNERQCKEIARTPRTAKVARRRQGGSDTNKTVAKLGESSIEIGKSQIITDRAANQFARLNATIEAAAPASGKGCVCQRGQGTGQADRHRHRGHQRQNRSHPDRYQGGRDAIDQIGKIINRSTTFKTPSPARWKSRRRPPTRLPQCERSRQGQQEISKNIANVPRPPRTHAGRQQYTDRRHRVVQARGRTERWWSSRMSERWIADRRGATPRVRASTPILGRTRALKRLC